MRISTLIRKLSELKEEHGDILVNADITEPAKCIVENYLETIEEIDSFSLDDIEEAQARAINGLEVQEVYFEDYNKNPFRKCVLIKLS